MTPTQRTLAAQAQLGRVCEIVEKFNYHVMRADGGFGIRQDAFGFLDILALDPDSAQGIVGIQSCGQDWSGHVTKLTVERRDIVTLWLKTGAKCEVWAWRKVKAKRGGKQMVWRARIGDVVLGPEGGVQVVERKPEDS